MQNDKNFMVVLGWRNQRMALRMSADSKPEVRRRLAKLLQRTRYDRIVSICRCSS